MATSDMITQYLASRGAAPSAQNASRVREHYASNPDLLDRRAMGLPGGLDDNSGVLDALLDKHIAESMPQVPQGSVEVGQPEKVPPPSRTGAVVKGAGEVGGTNAAKAGAPTGASRQAGYGPGASPSRQAGYDAPPVAKEGSNFTDGVGTGAQVGPMQRSGISEWLMGLLGAGSAAYGLSKLGGKGAPADAPQGPLPGSVPPAATAAAPTDGTDPAAMKARMQAEIDAENDSMARQMEEEARRRRAQSNTEDLGRAARRATGRR